MRTKCFNERQEIVAFQFQDEDILSKKNILDKPKNERSKRERDQVKDNVLKDGILYKCVNDNLLYFVPKTLR